MDLKGLRHIIREELSKQLNEEYVDKFKVRGILVSDTTKRPQQEILSDIRSLTGVIDGYPFIRHGGFSREKIQDIIASVKRVEGVKSFLVDPKNIQVM